MSEITSIQWADTTVNPIMGCGGCELYPSPRKVLAAIAEAMNSKAPETQTTSEIVKGIYKQLVDEVFLKSENPHQAHKQAVNVTNIWHLRERFEGKIREKHGTEVADAARDAIRTAITCYAGILHLNKGANILDREGIRPGKDKPREVKIGYAPIFEAVTQFKGRSAKTAELSDLLGMANPLTPWKARLPRMIFVSDMGDALSTMADFSFLKKDLMPAIGSEDGKRHLWLWLTKRPETMVKFAEEIGGFPPNVCAMTTLTGPDEVSLQRLADLKKVRADIRGLSIEPLWNRIPPSDLNLDGIDWLILGGESGSGDLTRPFALEWAEELREHCRAHGVAFFLKQLGRNPSRNGEIFKLRDKHGGEWEEWDESLRIREFPKAFHDYRSLEMIDSSKPRPAKTTKVPEESPDDLTITVEERKEFKKLDKSVRKGLVAFAEAGEALLKIHSGKLWRAGGYKSWDEYCRTVAGISRVHAHRLLHASRCMAELKTLPTGNVMPLTESQVRPLLKLPEPAKRGEAWKMAVKKAEGSQPTAAEVMAVVTEILHPDGKVTKPKPIDTPRNKVLISLKEAVKNQESWDEVGRLLGELEVLL
jgi:protein gp37